VRDLLFGPPEDNAASQTWTVTLIQWFFYIQVGLMALLYMLYES